MRARSALVVMCLAGGGLGTAVPNAEAAQHFMKVREVYAGSLLDANVDFVELQMYQFAQTQLNGHKLTIYDASGSLNECPITANVTNGNNQAPILFATTQAQSALSTTADFTIPPLISGSGGAVCFDDIDCMSWGSFPGGATDRDGGPGTPEPGGVPLGDSLDRRIEIAGSPTALEAADDTNNSSNDFESEDPSPDPNSPVNLATLTCTEKAGGDTEQPTSKITAPKHKTAIPVGERNFQGTAKDKGGSGVSSVEVALRQKRKGGCKWWNGNRFVAGGCRTKLFEMATGDKKWSYTLSKNMRRTGRKIKHYTLFSRATDGAGNAETDFVPKANLVKFEVFRGPITCEPGC